MISWSWEQIDPSRSATSGDLAKVFKNEGPKQPSLFTRNAPSPIATILAREVIQNSWDAARELRAETDELEDPFAITFDFRALSGDERSEFVASLDLEHLRGRADGLDRRQLGLGEHDCLTHLRTADELPVLVVEEQGASGMYGPWSSIDSKLYLALLSHGFTVKDSGSGGSHGYGKAGLITGSLTRTVVAYTCFRERADDPEVTRRLLAVTYWGPHELDGRRFSGFGRLGADVGSTVAPLENDEADRLAERLGLDVRDPAEIDQLGTTFVLVDPSIGAEELNEAIERNWWPAILDGEFDVDIRTPNGTMVPRPKSNDLLMPFIRGWELTTTPQDNDVSGEWSRRLNDMTLPSGQRAATGRVGLVADPEGWSFPLTLAKGGTDDKVEHRSLVALVRGPRMIVEYLDAGRGAPFVRGTFLADDEIDDLLRQTEPKAHDRWETDPSNLGVHPDAPIVAKSALDRVRRNVRDFRDRLRPATLTRREMQLTELDRLMGEVFGGSGGGGTRPARRRTTEVEMLEQGLVSTGDGLTIALRARIGVRSVGSAPSGARTSMRIRARIHEDGRGGTDFGLRVTPPPGFTDDGSGAFEGPLSGDWAKFSVETDPYHPDWSCRLTADATRPKVNT